MIEYQECTDYATGTYVRRTVGVGTTLYTLNESERVMSDVWEYVWRGYYWDGQRITNHWLNSNPDDDARWKTTHVIDADYDTILPQVYAKLLHCQRGIAREKLEAKAADPAVRGRTVRVTRGRTARGAQGTVVAVIERPYNAGYRSSLQHKLGVALDDVTEPYTAANGRVYQRHVNMVWVWAMNCQVVDPLVDAAEVEHHARVETAYQFNQIVERCRVNGRYTGGITAEQFAGHDTTAETV